MAFDFDLRDLVVKLAIDKDGIREKFAKDPDAVMAAHNLSQDAEDALKHSQEADLRTLLNQQVSLAIARRVVAAVDKEKGAQAAKKKAGKKGGRKGGKKR
jgi:hypothetical protein